MKPSKLTRALVRIIIMASVAFALFAMGREILALRSENDHLKVQMQMMASQAAEVVTTQWDTAARLAALDAKLTEQAAATFAKAQMQSQWEKVTTLISETWGEDAPMMQEFRPHPTTAFAQATVGLKAIKTNIAAIQDRLTKLEDSLQVRTEVLSRLPSILPADGWISSRFGYRKSPTTGQRDFHKGTDIAAREGSPVVAAASGVVKRAGWNGAYGKVVEIDHGEGLSTLYAHNGRLFVKEGDKVERGQKIGTIGLTGRTTGAHLHYEVRKAGVPVNPKRFLRVASVQPFDGSMDTFDPLELALAGRAPEPKATVNSLIQAQPVAEPLAWPDFRDLSGAASVSAAFADVASTQSETALVATFDPRALIVSCLFLCLLMLMQVWRKRPRRLFDRLSLVPMQMFTWLLASSRPTTHDEGEAVSYWS